MYSYYSKDYLYKKKIINEDTPVRELKKTGQQIKEDSFTVSMSNVYGEYEANAVEVIKRKREYTECAPIHFSHFILSRAKLHMLEFVDMIIDYWLTEHVTICYTGTLIFKIIYIIIVLDTDSIFVGLAVSFTEIAKPETAEYYWQNIYPKWFYDKNKDPPEKMRKPGVFKPEFTVTNGSYVGLSSKCYSVLDRSQGHQKKATKGISQRTPLEHKSFIDVLYGETEEKTIQPRFSFCKKTNTMKLVEQTKISLNPNLTKRFVFSDRVCTEPLRKNGKFL